MKHCSLLALLMVAAPAIAKVTPVPAATPTGPATSCVHLTNVRETRVRSDKVIDFYLADGKILRNTLPYGCPRLGFEQAFSYEVTTGQLCSVDIIRVIDRSLRTTGAACGLGQFQPVTVAR